MTRCRLFVFLMLISLALKAQQKPQYTQYILNNYIVNPALSGIENYIDVKAGYRQQWSGIENAPETKYFTVHMPIGKSDDRLSSTSFAMAGENPLGYSYRDEYMAAEPHHGVGLMTVIDETGPLSQSTVNLTYAYHLGLSARTNLSVGIGAGLSKWKLTTENLIVENEADPAITGAALNKIVPDLSAGLWLYSASYFFGVSVQQLLPQRFSFTSDSNRDTLSTTSPHYFATAGYRFWLNDDITVIPSIMLNGTKPSPLVFNFNARISFRDKFWLGAAFRKNDAISAMLGFNLSSLLNVGYAYDFTSSALNTVSRGTHEIVLGLTLNNRYKVTCPQKLW